MDDLLQEFLTETNEGLATLDQELVRLEQNPNDPKLLDNIFRIVHTIKGTCGFLGLPRLESVAHSAENLLGKFRDGTMTVSPDGVTIILAALDRIKSLLAALEATESEPAGDDKELIARINAMADDEAAPATAPAMVADMPTDEAPAADMVMEAVAAVEVAAEIEEAPEAESAPVEADEAPAPSTAVAKVSAAENTPAKESTVAAQSIRVHVDLLEDLMTMVSELVLTRNQLLQILRAQKESEFATPLQRLNLVTSELQEGVMKTRMQPIGNAWAKLPRVVRDLAMEVGKKIDLQMHGAETELDRQLLELIKDPLTHMVRNSADHGLETPDERRKAGKPEIGRIMLSARHEGGHIVIEISDDGRGLAIGKIKAKALKNGLATEAELAQMTDQQIQQFVFKAGFSTAAQVTSISGRGVGMDVVRTNIDKIGGTIELWSVEGKGTTFTIKIPLTLAIVNALIVECGGERFAVPQISVVELVRASANSDHRIEHVKGVPVLRLRNRLLPLVSLDRLLQLSNEARTRREQQLHHRHPGRDLRVRHHRRPGLRHGGNRREAGGAAAARPVAVLGQHHPRRRQRRHDPRSERHRRRDGRDRADRGRHGGRRHRRRAAGRRAHGAAAVPGRRPQTRARRAALAGRAPRGDRDRQDRALGRPSGRAVSRQADAAGVHRRHRAVQGKGPAAGHRVRRGRPDHGSRGRRDRRHRRGPPPGRARHASATACSAVRSSPASRPTSSTPATI